MINGISLESSGQPFQFDFLPFACLSHRQGYLEELVRLRDLQLQELQSRHNRMLDTLRHLETETHRDRRQLENVIIELQAQLWVWREHFIIPSAQPSWRGVYWFHLVCLSICGQNHVYSVCSTILTGSI